LPLTTGAFCCAGIPCYFSPSRRFGMLLSKDIELSLYSKAWLCSSRRNYSWQANGTTRIYSKASIAENPLLAVVILFCGSFENEFSLSPTENYQYWE
jgi:hypothetical protein